MEEYILGVADDEIARLGLQHRAWRPRVLDAWRTAGIGAGNTVLDVGCGPGFASLDLADLVGPQGRVIAIDKSQRFLEVVSQQGRANITTHSADFDSGAFPDTPADAAWCRWVLAFVQRPRDVLESIARSLKPGGVFVSHEYFDYSTWRAMPECPELEEFVAAVIASWRGTGGEPDIARRLPTWLDELGFEVREVRPYIDATRRGDLLWEWPRAFLQVGRRVLVEAGYMTAARAEEIWDAFLALEAKPMARVVTPGLMEIVAVKRRT